MMNLNPSVGKLEDNPISKNPIVITRHTLLDLSTEVLVEILAYLPAVGLFSVQRTCRTIRDIIAGTTYFQYTMRAYINGVDDLLPLDFPHSERLELLRRHEQSWNNLQVRARIFTQCVTDDVPYTSNFILQDGYLIYECLTPGLQRYGYVDLCSASQDEELSWVHITMDPLPISTVTFAVDHDLMVATGYCIASNLIIESLTGYRNPWRPHMMGTMLQFTFFQFTTGAPHPLSSTHTVSLPRDPEQPFTVASQEVLGDHVLVTAGGQNDAALYLVTWKTGAVTLVSSQASNFPSEL
jgi:F-box domain